MSNTISTALGMVPIPSQVSNTTPVVVPPSNINTDFEFARTNMYDAITKGQDALDELINLAKQQQAARGFEVVSTMINTLIAANKELLDIHKKHQDLSKTDEPSGKQNIHNNLVISSADLLNMIKGKENGK
jgi:hypothetical protein